ncbi:MAG: MFS transporter [Firmicutes bacterium]|nr:MFS transporter [Bacillota bacterium]
MSIRSGPGDRVSGEVGRVVKSGAGQGGAGPGRVNLWSLAFVALCLVPFVMVLGNSMLIPVFPKIESALSLSQFQVGLLVTAFSLPAGLLIPFAGFLSDRIGRKKIIVPALVVYGLGGLVAGLASLWLRDPYKVIIAGRIIQGAGAGGTYQLAMALAGDLYGRENMPRTLGALEASNGLGKVVSPILGSAAMAISWYLPFFVYGIFSIPVAVLVLLAVKESNPGGEGKSTAQYFSSVKEIIKEKGLSLAVTFVVGFVALGMLFGLLSYLSDVLEQKFHLYNLRKGFAIAVPVTVMAATSFFGGIWLQRRKHLLKATIVLGMALTAAALFTIPIFDSPWYFFAVVVIAGLGIGMVLPPLNTLITGSADPEERGIITALYGTVRFTGVAVGPPAFGLIGFDSPWLFAAAAAITGVAGVLGWLFVDQERLLSKAA